MRVIGLLGHLSGFRNLARRKGFKEEYRFMGKPIYHPDDSSIALFPPVCDTEGIERVVEYANLHKALMLWLAPVETFDTDVMCLGLELTPSFVYPPFDFLLGYPVEQDINLKCSQHPVGSEMDVGDSEKGDARHRDNGPKYHVRDRGNMFSLMYVLARLKNSVPYNIICSVMGEVEMGIELNEQDMFSDLIDIGMGVLLTESGQSHRD